LRGSQVLDIPNRIWTDTQIAKQWQSFTESEGRKSTPPVRVEQSPSEEAQGRLWDSGVLMPWFGWVFTAKGYLGGA
jgi:hypothetical protein